MRRAILRHKRVFALSVAVVPLVIVLAAWHYYTVYASLAQARDNLLSTRARLSDVGLNLSEADLAVAREKLASAQDNVDRARDHMAWDPLIRFAGVLPVLDEQVSAVDDLLDMAGLLIQIGDGATTAGEKAIAVRDRPASGRPLTASLVDLINDARPDVERLDALARELVQRRLEMGDAALLPPLARARDRLDEELPRVANAIEQARQSQDLLPGFLGFSGDRRYLVLALNSGELLPGGGLVTAAGVLPVSEGVNGDLDFTDSVKWKEQAEALRVPYIEPPGPLKRYLLRDYTWNLLVSNWSPDFPTWSQQALEFYELVHGPQHVDGIIAVDLTVLERLLAITGPKTLDVAGHGAVTFDRTNAVLQLEELTRQPFEPTDDRKSVVGDLAEAVISDLLRLPSSSWATAVDVIRQLGEERHIQVLSFDPREQTVIRDVRWDGRMDQPKGDYFSFNEASLLSTKLNLLIRPEGTLRVDVNALGDAHHELTLSYRNPLPEWSQGKDPGLVQQLMLGGLYGGYLRLLGPPGTVNEQTDLDGVPTAIEDTGHDGGMDWFAAFLTLPSGASRQATFRWDVALVDHDPADGFDLHIQKQPGTDGLCLDLSLMREGKPASAIAVQGGAWDGKSRVCLTTDVSVHATF